MADIAQNGEGRAIVILGAAVWSNAQPSPTLSRRIAKAAEFARLLPDAKIICSGGVGINPPSEAEVMQRVLIGHGLDERQILLEPGSKTTFENAKNSIALMRDAGLGTAIVVTDAYHLPRAVMTFRLLGMPAQGKASRRDPRTPLRRWVWYWLRELAALPVYLARLLIRRGGSRQT